MSVSKSVVKATGWDPTSPATLRVPTIDSGGAGVDSGQSEGINILVNYISCDSGIGCNTFESSAVMNLLDARDAYLEETKSFAAYGQHHHQARRRLARKYRNALANCINEWSEDIEKRKENSQEEFKEKQQQDDVFIHLDLLKATYAVTHLSEIFLLSPSSREDHDESTSTIGYGYENDMWNLPGAVTADTVRYLRKHHFGEIENLFDPTVVEQLHQLWQPDQYGGDNTEGNAYWDVVEAYIVWGCLEDAWALLSHHSIVRRFVQMEEQMMQGNGINDYQNASLAEDREGFLALRSILLSAPIPGGRSIASDEELADDQNESNNTRKDDIQNERNGNDNPIAIEEEPIQGIPTSAYCLWETSSGEDGNKSRSGDYHVTFEPNAAYQIHQHWKQAIDTIPSLQRLRRRIPQLNNLMTLLTGNFRGIEFGSWQAELCAELLYKNPNIRLMDMNVRASFLVNKHGHGPGGNNEMNDNAGNDMIDVMALNIMRGNAGEVVKAMHAFGGGSGAALPAVMVCISGSRCGV